MRRALIAAALVAILSACEVSAPATTEPSRPATPGETDSPTPPQTLKVAYVQDLSPENADDTTLPPLYALELAFATTDSVGPIEVVPFDTQGTASAVQEIATEIANDAGFVAAVGAPNLGDLRGLVEILSPALVPVLSLSARDAVEDAAPGTWFRFVAPLRVQASALAEGVGSMRRARDGVCLMTAPGDGTVFSRTLRRELSARLRLVETPEAADVSLAGCGLVVWPGGGLGGAALALELEDLATAHGPLIGGPGLLEPDFLDDAGAEAEPALAYCSCADVSTSLGLRARRFIQDLQSQYGSPPGPYAVEAWDAAHMLIEALREAGTTRLDVTTRLAASGSFEALGGPYAFEGGELGDPVAAIRLYRVEGGRWVPTDATGG